MLKLGQHRVEHPTGDLVAMVGVIQSEGKDIPCSLDDQSGYVGTRRVGFLRRHAATLYKDRSCVNNGQCSFTEKMHYWLLEGAPIFDNSAADVTNI